MNSVMLAGRLTKKPELYEGETPRTLLSIAINEGKDKTEFISCTAFGKTAELVCTYCDKGDMIGVEGRLSTYVKENNGSKDYRLSCIANRVEFLGKAGSKSEGEAKPTTSKYAEGTLSVTPDDLPF